MGIIHLSRALLFLCLLLAGCGNNEDNFVITGEGTAPSDSSVLLGTPMQYAGLRKYRDSRRVRASFTDT
ncbi:MAG: hypothetical protein WC314_24725 [Vulcanimicrobiota bacterium]